MVYATMLKLTFSWLDYLVFFGMLSLSGMIGIFFGCFGTKQNSGSEYLLGGRHLHVFPVSMSIIASTTSGMAVLGLSADVYRYGAAYVWTIIPIIVTSITSIYVYMPVFLKLEVVTTFQYLSIRFGSSTKTFASIIYVVHLIIYNPVVIFLPCLAFSQATGYNVYLLAPATTAFCVLYTAIGGLKTVVWTDALQTVSILLGSLVILVMGLYQSGGVANIFRIAAEGQRIDVFNFDLNPTIRDNFWTYALGATSAWMADVGISQTTLQRLSAVSSFTQAKIVMLLFCLICIVLRLISVITGIAIYAKYSDCDPLQSGKIGHLDQIVPYYVMEVGKSTLGLAGLFIAGVFAAALSTLSTNLLNLGTIIYTDFLPAFIRTSVSDTRQSYILKLIVLTVGVLDCGLVFVVGKFGGLMQLGMSLLGISYGTFLGLFTLGMIFPIANKQGALCGGIAGLIFSSSMVFGNLWYKYKGLLPDNPKPISTEGCNGTTSPMSEIYNVFGGEIPSTFFRVSFWYYPFYGCLIVLAVGLLVSWMTCKNNPKLRPELISPMFQFLLSEKETPKPKP